MWNQIDGLIVSSRKNKQILFSKQSYQSTNRQLKPAFIQSQLEKAKDNIYEQIKRRKRHTKPQHAHSIRKLDEQVTEYNHQSNLWAVDIIHTLFTPPHFFPDESGQLHYQTLSDGRVAILTFYGDLLYVLIATTIVDQVPLLFKKQHSTFRPPTRSCPSEMMMGLTMTHCLASIRAAAKKVPDDESSFLKYYSKIALAIDAFLWGKDATQDQEYAMFHLVETT
mmetsp:Transcript_3503/g.5146  ORF Transcript_3503/g.5146 Transcript_3503/m.5146 type:complete len:223 (-) Transcript_3503:611-1279(-)